MEFLQGDELHEERSKTELLMKKFLDQISYLKSENIEKMEKELNQETDLLSKKYKLKKYMEKNLPACAKLLDMVLLPKAKNTFEHLEFLSLRSQVAMSLEDFPKARKLAEEAFSIVKEKYDRIGQTYFDPDLPSRTVYKAYLQCCIDLLLICRYQGNLKDAEDYLNKAQNAVEKNGDIEDSHLVRILKGDLLLAKGFLNEAIESVFTPLLNQQSLSKTNHGLLLQKLGNACRSAARWGQAKAHLRKSIQIARELNDRTAEFDRTTDLGNVYRSEGRIADALTEQSKHMAYAFNRGDLWGLTVACFNTGFAYYSVTPKPDLSKALALLALKYELATQTHNEPLKGMALNNLGKVFCALGKNDIAIQVMTQAVEVAKKTLNIAGEGMAYGNIGTACRALGKYEDAIINHEKYLKNALARGDDGGAAIMQRELCIDYLCKGDLETAEKQVREAISTLEIIRNKLGGEDSSKIANFDKNQAETYSLLQVVLVRQGKYSEALALSELARSRALTDIIGSTYLQTSLTKSDSWIYKNEFVTSEWNELVEEILSTFLTTADKLQTNFLVYSVLRDYDSKGKSHQYLYIWLVKCKKDTLEDDKRIIFRSLALQKTLPHNIIADERFFTSLTRTFRNISNIFSILDISLLTKQPENEDDQEGFLEPSIIPDSLQVKELMQLFESMFLSKVSQEEVIQPSSPKRDYNVHENDISSNEPKSEDLNEIPEDMERLMERSSWSVEGAAQLQRLYEVCVAPIDDNLPKSTTDQVPNITIIPHEFLFSVPFCCLRGENNEYFVERFVLNYTPSLRALCLLNQRLKYLQTQQGQRKLKLLAIGDPKHRLPIDELPYAGEEAKYVREVFGKEQCEIKIREEANKQSILKGMKEVDVLHVATHACPEEKKLDHKTQGDYSMHGCLIVARAEDQEPEESFLQAQEIASSSCICQLIMLSCCETGLGKVTSDGVIGLYRAFFAAGAAAVLVTLWKIRDSITPIYMNYFYNRFKETNNVSQSLRDAMLFCIREKKLPPSDWAAFTLVGAFY